MADPSEDKFFEELFKEYFLTKFIDWKYEKEWRAIGGHSGIATYPAECIDRIIFGLNMPKKNRENIRLILNNRKIDFFEAVKSKKHFGVEILKIN